MLATVSVLRIELGTFGRVAGAVTTGLSSSPLPQLTNHNFVNLKNDQVHEMLAVFNCFSRLLVRVNIRRKAFVALRLRGCSLSWWDIMK